MHGRRFIASLGTAIALTCVAAAQQKAIPAIGYLNSASPGPAAPYMAAFRQGLTETGFVEGQNLAIEYRWAEGHYDRLPALAADLVGRKVDLVVTSGGTPPARAAKDASSTIPIVFVGGDPIADHLVASLARPGGNLTGMIFMTAEMVPKRLELLSELVPQAGAIALLVNPDNPIPGPIMRDVQDAARAKGVQLHILKAAARHAVPVIYDFRQNAAAGGLISYGPSLTHVNYQAGVYAGRILKGEKPADLPVQQPTTFELVVNLNTARALGLTVPPSILARADEVIE